MPTQKPYTFAIRTSQRLTQNCKRVCLANAQEVMKIVANLKGKLTENNECQWVTKCINHWADSANFKGITSNKHCGGLTGNCFEMPNASYTNR